MGALSTSPGSSGGNLQGSTFGNLQGKADGAAGVGPGAGNATKLSPELNGRLKDVFLAFSGTN